MNEAVKKELVEYFAKQAAAQVQRQYDYLLGMFGVNFNGVYNSKFYRVFDMTVRPCCAVTYPEAIKRPGEGEYRIDPDKLATFVARYAEVAAAEVLAKVAGKVGELEDGKAVRAGVADFIITGKKDGRDVRIEQQQIVNVSVKGKLFNQYPARIYVDGKFISAAAFAKL